MKPVKRARCPICNSKKDVDSAKAKIKCPKDGAEMVLSDDWYVRLSLPDGTRPYQPCGPRLTDAKDYIAACRMAKRSGSALPGQEKDVSWADAVKNCDDWWDKAKIRPATREHYTYQVKVLDKYFFGTSLLTITKSSVETFMEKLGKTNAPASVVHAVKCLKRMYTMHLENLDLEDNPRPKLMEKAFIINKIKMPEVDNEKTSSCTVADLQMILSAIQTGRGKKLDKQRLVLAINMGVGMMMRPININGLMWSDIDMENGIIHLDKGVMKGKRDSEKAIPASILEELKAWKEVSTKSEYVFPSPSDPEVPMKNMARAIRGWITRTGMNAEGVSRKEKITPYVLTRHTGATLLYEDSGENLEMVSKTLDHADSRITRRRYVKNRVDYAKRTVIPIQEAMLRRIR